MPIVYRSDEEMLQNAWTPQREKAPAVPFDAIAFQRRYRLKAQQAREDRLLVLWAIVALVTGLGLVGLSWF
jgi:hypothetical protein